MDSTTIHFLNVGHGDCTIIEHASRRITMIDINNSTSLPEEDEIALAESKGLSLTGFRTASTSGRSWEEYYRAMLVDPSEYWSEKFTGRSVFRYVQTHPDMDHMGGLHRMFWQDQVTLENFWDVDHAKDFNDGDFDHSSHSEVDWLVYKLLRGGNGPNDTTHKVHHKTLGDEGSFWTEDGLSVLSPTVQLIEYCNNVERWNNASQMLKLSYGGRTVILPGDAEKPAWDSVEANIDPETLVCDVLKAAHHGRESGYSESAVTAMSPAVVICSVGKKPSTDASNEYRDNHGATVLSTRYNGTITAKIWADGEVWINDRKGDRLATLDPL